MQAKYFATALILIAIAAVAYAGSIGLGFKPAAQPTPAAMPAGQYSLSLQGSGIIVEPGTTVEVGEEVYFDGSGVTIPEAALLPNGMIEGSYVWDFGDGYYIDGGTAISHFYTRAGTYTVTLDVTDVNGRNEVAETTITVTGEGPKESPRLNGQMLLELKFDREDLTDTSDSGLTASWVGDAAYADGPGGKSADLTGGAYISVAEPEHILNGMTELTISLWAKKATDATTGYLIDNDDVYSIWLNATTALRAIVITTSDSKLLQAYPSAMGNTMWHHYVLTYNGTTAKLYLDGTEVGSEAHTGTIVDVSSNLLIGKQFDGVDVFDGYIDSVRIYGKAIEEFELWHAPFHGRIAQYLYAQIPSDVVADSTYEIKVEIEGDNGYYDILLEKANLQSEEKFLLNNAKLPAGNYVLTAQLIDPSDPSNHLDKIIEKFEKPYDGIPKVGIDENNAIRIRQSVGDMEGELFFPVAPWMLNSPIVPDWASEGYINSLYSTGWFSESEYTSDTWEQYLDTGYENNLVSIGPNRFEGKGTLPRQDPLYYERNTDTNKITEYVEGARDHPGLLMWMWDDEPDLGGDTQYLPPAVLRAWTYLSHRDDPQHLVATNFGGRKWTSEIGWHVARRREYEYLWNEDQFGGKKTHVTDVLGLDYYPIDWQVLKDATMEKLAGALDTLREETYNLVPYMVFVETEDIRDDTLKRYGDRRHDPDMTPPPTPEQLKMLIWLTVIHGVKGVNWFHWFNDDYAQDNYPVMAEFLDQITRLTPIVLSGEPNRTVSDNANTAGNRVDTMIKEHEGKVYIFAVRLTEVNEADDPPIDVTFNIEGINDATASVFDDSETINVANGTFQDSFAPNDVHIYKIALAPECTIDSECPGQICCNTTCIDPLCTATTGCLAEEQCIEPGTCDAQCQPITECIDTPALLDHISQWNQGQMTMLSLMQNIGLWKAGTGCSP